MPQSTPLNVAVIGCGIAGAAAALFLARAGHAVTVFERVPNPGPVGAGILLQPSGMAVLHALGLASAVLAHGARIEQLYGTNHSGRTVMQLRYANYRGAVPIDRCFGVGLLRGVLFHAFDGALKQQGIAVHLGIDVANITQTTSGARLMDAQGNGLDEFDLVILADGTRSTLRAAIAPQVQAHAREYPWGAYWAVLDAGNFAYPATLRQWYRRAHQMFGLMPSGTHWQDTQQQISFFWSIAAKDESATRARGLAALKADVTALTPEAAPYLDQLVSFEQLTPVRYSDVRLWPWHRGRVVAIGDCAHATSPQLGNGANLALIDAWTLGTLCATANAGAVPAALARYSQMRRAHLRYYQWASHFLTPMFQSDAIVLPWLRDQFMASLTKISLFEQQNLQTLIGVKAGWLTGEFHLPV